MSQDAGADRAAQLRAELEAARRELAETAEALAARAAASPPPSEPPSNPPVAPPSNPLTGGAELVPAATRLPVPYRPAASPRRRVAVGVALGVAVLLLRRLAR